MFSKKSSRTPLGLRFDLMLKQVVSPTGSASIDGCVKGRSTADCSGYFRLSVHKPDNYFLRPSFSMVAR
jgi:hypothetical protein